MSKFSERCKFHLNEHGITLYECSQKSGIERTTLHRMVTGKRLPTKETLTTFCKYLRLGNNARDELSELYYEEKIGTAKYQNRKFIQMLLEYMANTELDSTLNEPILFNPSYSFDVPAGEGHFYFPAQTTTVFQTQTMIRQLLAYTFTQGKRQNIYTNLPHTFEQFFTDIRTLFFTQKKDLITIYHLFAFLSSPERSVHVNHNLEILFQILPLALSSYKDYQPYYSYSNFVINDMDFVPWNYFLVTDDYAMAISADMTTAIIHHDPKIIHSYHNRAEQIKERMHPLLNPTSVFGQVCDYYHYFNNALGTPIYTMEYTPCLSFLFSDSEISRLLHTLPKELAEQTSEDIINNIFNTLISVTHKNTIHIFSRHGLEYFMRTGKLPGQGAYYLPALSINDRKKALNNLLKYVKQAEQAFICLDTNFAAPQNIYIELYENDAILFLYFFPNSDMHFCYIQESSLYDAFYDFMSSINEAGLALSNQELMAIINSYLN